MHVLPKIERIPQEVLGLSDEFSVENLLAAYKNSIAKLSEKRTLENPSDIPITTQSEIEWAFKVLMALKRSHQGQDIREGEEGIVSAVLLPGLDSLTVENLGREATNVVALPFRPHFNDAENEKKPLASDLYFPELKDILESVAKNTPEISSQKFQRSLPIEPTLARSADLPKEESFKLSSPLSSRSFAPNLTTPKTIRTVIGGDDKPVVHTVSPLGLSKETQIAYQQILAGADQANGTVLKSLRLAAGIDSWELSQRTRISLEHLHSLETDNYDELPAPVYYRGYLSAYLKYLGLQRTDLIEALCETYRVQKRNRVQRNK